MSAFLKQRELTFFYLITVHFVLFFLAQNMQNKPLNFFDSRKHKRCNYFKHYKQSHLKVWTLQWYDSRIKTHWHPKDLLLSACLNTNQKQKPKIIMDKFHRNDVAIRSLHNWKPVEYLNCPKKETEVVVTQPETWWSWTAKKTVLFCL